MRENLTTAQGYKQIKIIPALYTRIKCAKPNLSLYSPYYAEACNEFAVPNSES